MSGGEIPDILDIDMSQPIINKQFVHDELQIPEDLYYELLPQFEPNLIECLEGVRTELEEEEKNWKELKRFVHSLKGSSSYIGAKILQAYCQNMQVAAMNTDMEEYLRLYPQMMTAAIAVKSEVIRMIESRNGPAEKIDECQLPLAEGFLIVEKQVEEQQGGIRRDKIVQKKRSIIQECVAEEEEEKLVQNCQLIRSCCIIF